MFRSLAAPPLVTVTMKPPTPAATYCEPSYGTGTGLGSGSARAPVAAGLASPFVSAHSARSRPDSAMARACAFAIWLLAMKGTPPIIIAATDGADRCWQPAAVRMMPMERDG